MWVPLSVMQYCHHSALVRGVGDVCFSVSHAILPSVEVWEMCVPRSVNIAITLP